jgi:hypothetical protein
MDYLFIIEFNSRPPASVEALKGTIREFGKDILYLENDVPSKGIVGIVRFAEQKTTDESDKFFEQLRGLVAKDLNHLNLEKVESRSLSPEDPEINGANLAKWARASIRDVLVGFDVAGTAELNNDDNSYEIVSTLKGGIGGKR